MAGRVLDQLQIEFDHVHRLLLEIFASAGSRILPMSDRDHFRHYKQFLNPSFNERFDHDPTDGFEPELSIQENCWHSEGNAQSDSGFFMDGHYHALIVLTRSPRSVIKSWRLPRSCCRGVAMATMAERKIPRVCGAGKQELRRATRLINFNV